MTDHEHTQMLSRLELRCLEVALANHNDRIGAALDAAADRSATTEPMLHVPMGILIDAASSVVPAVEYYLAIHERTEV